jgi:hypothetical protein
MIGIRKLGLLREGRFWVDNLPEINYVEIDKLTESVSQSQFYQSNGHATMALELSFPQHVSSYVLLGVKFEPSDGASIHVNVKVGCEQDNLLTDNIAPFYDTIHVGIPKEYAGAVLESAVQTVNELKDFPTGLLTFDFGAHSLVRSSRVIFSKATFTLTRLIHHKIRGVPTTELKDLIHLELQRVGLI